MTAIAAYQSRLRALVDEAKGDKGLRDLARRMGDENLRTTLSYWLKEDLAQPLRGDSYVALSKVDPRGRNENEIEYWLKTGEDLPTVGCGVAGLRQMAEDMPEKDLRESLSYSLKENLLRSAVLS